MGINEKEKIKRNINRKSNCLYAMVLVAGILCGSCVHDEWRLESCGSLQQVKTSGVKSPFRENGQRDMQFCLMCFHSLPFSAGRGYGSPPLFSSVNLVRKQEAVAVFASPGDSVFPALQISSPCGKTRGGGAGEEPII
jgi:hypothetical protein